MQQYGVSSTGPWLVKALEVLFWSYGSVALLVVIFQYWVIFASERLPVEDAIPGWILPAYPFLVLGPLAAAICVDQRGGSKVNIWVGGVGFQGLGWILAFLLYTLYFTRLVSGKLPAESLRPGMYIAVGPACMFVLDLNRWSKTNGHSVYGARHHSVGGRSA
jgi:tellurite resistance protein TehA-like permease